MCVLVRQSTALNTSDKIICPLIRETTITSQMMTIRGEVQFVEQLPHG